MRFGNIGAWAPPLEALLTIAAQDQPAGPACDLGHGLGPKVFDNRIERGGDGRQRTELLDKRIARGNGARAENGIALLVAHCLGAEVAVLVGEDLHQAHREALGEVVDDKFARGQIDIERFAFFIGQVSEAPVKHGFGGRDQLHYNRMVCTKRFFHRRDQARQFHREQELGKEALLGAFKDRKRRGLGIAVEGIAAVLVDHPRCLQCRFEVAVNNRPGIGIGIVDSHLRFGQAMFEDLVLDPGEGQGAGKIETLRLEVAGD